ncbi:MAG: DUF751 family protein [Gloeomargarita sp. GMQP_bins_120]
MARLDAHRDSRPHWERKLKGLAAMEGFWTNVGRYLRYFVTVILGVFWTAARSLQRLSQRPVTAIATITLLVSGVSLVYFTLLAMLGY